MDTETDLVVKLTFQAGFSREACRNAWGKVGATPLTRDCIENKKVCKSLEDGTDAYQALLKNIQLSNDILTHTLMLMGYKGEVLQAMIKEYPEMEAITEEHSEDCLALLAKVNTCGKLFSVDIAGHLTANDISLATKKTVQEKEKKWLTIEKTRRMRLMKVEEKAKGILETKGVNGTNWTLVDFDTILTWYNYPKPNKLTIKEEKMIAWTEMRAKGLKEPLACVTWTDEEEVMLLKAGKDNIELGGTALGWAKKRKMSECKQALGDMSNKEFEELLAARANRAT